ncbi:MAG: type VI secretion system contractile sheath small subunit [Candidatus Thiodiazotropha sp. (ex Ctena orbiculata)]|nr:type VI secretion system contractile sheath small subunit [Candidatus Thiodiazotropha taylori]
MAQRLNLSVELGNKHQGGDRSSSESPRLKFILLGCFSGNRESSDPQLNPLPGVCKVDLDNFDDLISEMQPCLKIDLSELTEPLQLSFSSLDDFHPDQLHKQLPTPQESASAEPQEPKQSDTQSDSASNGSLESDQQTLDLITTSAETVEGIESRLNELVGVDQAPNLSTLVKLLKEIADEVAQRCGLESASETSETAVDGSAAAQNQPAAPGTINNRDDVIKTLERITQYYEKNEPSSPIPLLLDRAKRLVKMDFYEIVQDLAPGGSSHFDFLWKQEDR